MNVADTSTPVVVLKLEHYGGLGIVRSLGRLGVSVFGVDVSPRAPALVSQFCRGKFVWDVDHHDQVHTVEYLLNVGRSLGRRAILIPTSDETVLLVARHAGELGKQFLIPQQSEQLVRTLCSKKEMYFLAKRVGIPTAETEFPQSKDDVRRFLERATLPVMLKGIDGGLLEKRTGKKMVVVRTAEELLEQYDALENPEHPNLMLQEYIPGKEDSVWMFNGYFNKRSECLLGFTGKKIRQNPVYTGMTSLGICLWNQTVAEMTKQFMRSIGYQGILDIGYRYDARDGKYKVLDVNPRIGATFRLFVGNYGMDVVRALYLDMTDQQVPPDSLREGRKWIVEDKDLRSSWKYFRDGALNIGDWMRSMRGIEEGGYFAWDDLLPFVVMWQAHIVRKSRRILRPQKDAGIMVTQRIPEDVPANAYEGDRQETPEGVRFRAASFAEKDAEH